MKRKILSIVMALTVVIGIVFAGCGSKPDDKKTTDGSGPSSGTAEYAIILKPLSNDFWANMKAGIEKEAKELGVTVDVFAAQSKMIPRVSLKFLKTASPRATRP